MCLFLFCSVVSNEMVFDLAVQSESPYFPDSRSSSRYSCDVFSYVRRVRRFQLVWTLI